MKTVYIVKTAAACMPSSCWGTYRRVAVLECEAWQTAPSMISNRARGVVRVVQTWERLNVGLTDRCAYRQALIEAEHLCVQLNEDKN